MVSWKFDAFGRKKSRTKVVSTLKSPGFDDCIYFSVPIFFVCEGSVLNAVTKSAANDKPALALGEVHVVQWA